MLFTRHGHPRGDRSHAPDRGQERADAFGFSEDQPLGHGISNRATGRYPKDLAELNKPLPKDVYSPTGEDYHYEAQRSRFILSSCGKDGIYGNDDDEILITLSRGGADFGPATRDCIRSRKRKRSRRQSIGNGGGGTSPGQLFDQRQSRLGGDRQARRSCEDVLALQCYPRLDLHQHRQRRHFHVQGYPQGAVFAAIVAYGRIPGCRLQSRRQTRPIPAVFAQRRRAPLRHRAEGQASLSHFRQNPGRKREDTGRHRYFDRIGLV